MHACTLNFIRNLARAIGLKVSEKYVILVVKDLGTVLYLVGEGGGGVIFRFLDVHSRKYEL